MYVKQTIVLKKLLLSCITFYFFCSCICAQSVTPDSKYQVLTGSNFVQSKNYYLLTLLSELKDVKALLDKDLVLSAIGKTKVDSLSKSLKSCGRDGVCYINRMKFSNAEIQTISERLGELYSPGNPLDKLVLNHLIPSGTYILFQNLPAKEMLVKAWEQDAAGINFALGVMPGETSPIIR